MTDRLLPNYAVFASGSGTIFQSILDAQAKEKVAGRLVLFVTDEPNCQAKKRAEQAGVETQVFSIQSYPQKKAREKAILETLTEKNVDFIVLSGYMQLLSSYFIRHYPEKIINTHPSLLPAFKGIEAVKRAFDYGVKITGCTVHIVNEEMDGGPILLQQPVRVLPGDSVTCLHEKIKVEERKLVVKALNALLKGNITMQNQHRWVMKDA